MRTATALRTALLLFLVADVHLLQARGRSGEDTRQYGTDDSVALSERRRSNQECQDRTPSPLIPVLLLAGGCVSYVAESLSSESKLVDYDELPLLVRQWKEWEGVEALKNLATNGHHMVDTKAFATVLRKHLSRRGVHVTNEEATRMASLVPLPLTSQAETVKPILDLINHGNAADLINPNLVNEDQTFAEKLGVLIPKHLRRSGSCAQISFDEITRGNWEVGLKKWMFEVLNIIGRKSTDHMTPDDELKLLDIHNKLERLVKSGLEDESSGVEVDLFNRAARLGLSTSAVNFPFILQNHHQSDWNDIKCAVDFLQFVVDFEQKMRARDQPRPQHSPDFYQLPNFMKDKNMFESQDLNKRLGQGKFSKVKLVFTIFFFSAMVLILLMIVVAPAGERSWELRRTSDSCKAANYEPPSPSVESVGPSSVFLSWPETKPCQLEFVKKLSLVWGRGTPSAKITDGVSQTKDLSNLMATSTTLPDLAPNTVYHFRLVALVEDDGDGFRSSPLTVAKTSTDGIVKPL